KWIADLHGRSLGVRPFVKRARCHGRAMNAIATGFRADVKDRIPFTGCPPPEDAFAWSDPDAHDVHERVLIVDIVKVDLAADGRDADAVPIGADAGDDAFKKKLI